MFCSKCGTNNNDGVRYCVNCGAELQQPAASQYTQPTPRPVVMPPITAAGPTQPTKVLVFGIIGLALSELGIPGIILSIIALHFANKFLQENGMLFGKAKIGRILGMVGLFVGIGMTVFWTV